MKLMKCSSRDWIANCLLISKQNTAEQQHAGKTGTRLVLPRDIQLHFSKPNKANESLWWANHHSHTYRPLSLCFSLANATLTNHAFQMPSQEQNKPTYKELTAPEKLGSFLFHLLKHVSTELLGRTTKRLRKKKSILKNNDSVEKASFWKMGIRAAANIQSVCVCHRTFESIRVKFRLKHN